MAYALGPFDFDQNDSQVCFYKGKLCTIKKILLLVFSSVEWLPKGTFVLTLLQRELPKPGPHQLGKSMLFISTNEQTKWFFCLVLRDNIQLRWSGFWYALNVARLLNFKSRFVLEVCLHRSQWWRVTRIKYDLITLIKVSRG